VELAAAGGPPGWAELALRISGAVVSVLLAGLVAAFGAFLTPFRIGTALVPVSLVIAIGGIAGLTWFAYTVTRHRLLGLLPGVVWIAVTFLAATRTHEGDLVLISTDWVASVYLLLGPLALAACAYRLLAPTRR
jgi:fatty-acid desaturase